MNSVPLLSEFSQTVSIGLNIILSIVCALLGMSRADWKDMYHMQKKACEQYFKSHRTLEEIILIVDKHKDNV